MDLVTNITHCDSHLCRNINGVYFRHDPCMVLKHGVFLDNFKVYGNLEYREASKNIECYTKVLETDLNKNYFSKGLFSTNKNNFGILNLIMCRKF